MSRLPSAQRYPSLAKPAFPWEKLTPFLFLLILVVSTWYLIHLPRKTVPTPVTHPSATTSPIASLATPPDSWPNYSSPYGFSISYPPDWGVDDSYLTTYQTLHAAFLGNGNHITIYKNQINEDDPTKDPSLTITTSSLTDENSLLHTPITSAKDWLTQTATGLPPGVITTSLLIQGADAVRLTGLSPLKGKYEVIYLVDLTKGMVARFDYTYPNDSDLEDLDEITGSFKPQ